MIARTSLVRQIKLEDNPAGRQSDRGSSPAANGQDHRHPNWLNTINVRRPAITPRCSALGLSDMFFINMQARYEAEIARDKLAVELGTIERIA